METKRKRYCHSCHERISRSATKCHNCGTLTLPWTYYIWLICFGMLALVVLWKFYF